VIPFDPANPLAIPAEFITELALNIHPTPRLCAKYGLTDQDFLVLHTMEWFNRAVSDKRTELEKAGFDFKAKMKMLAEDMIVDAYHAAKLSTAVTPKLDVAKHLTKLAGLDPQPGSFDVPGTGFTISISLPKQYIDSLHDRPSKEHDELRELTLTQNDYTNDYTPVPDGVELSGEPPQVQHILSALETNKDLA
jgi:hypothetical protein